MIALTHRQEALLLIMEQPDPADLPRRAHVWIYRSPANRDAMLSEMLLRWMARREVESTNSGC